MKKIYTILVCIWLLAGFVACEKDKDFALTTLTVQNETITPSYGSATISCAFKADATISEAFVQYSLSSSFAKYDVAKMIEEKGKYAAQLMGLADNTTYYIRYEVSNKYSRVVTMEVKAFTTKEKATSDPSSNLRAMPFSVSESKQVYFSKGNLQYHPANDEWRFAESQLDYIGAANSNISSSYNGWLDLFGWSTSTTNFGVSTSTSDSDYSGSFVDWGTNQIGADAPNTWRTLTYDEWNYLRNGRPNASSLRGVAQVNGVNGLIFLPDNWTCPEGITIKSGFHSSYGVDYYAAYQTFTAEQWSKLEAAGAVFLPAAGYRRGSNVGYVQVYGYYWSASEYGSYGAVCLSFDSGDAGMYGNDRYIGQSVRLVKDL